MRGRAKRARRAIKGHTRVTPPLDSENETETNTAAHTSRARFGPLTLSDAPHARTLTPAPRARIRRRNGRAP